MSGPVADLFTASAAFAAMPVSQVFGAITGSTTITGNGCINVINIVGGIDITGTDELRIQGSSEDYFIINITGDMIAGRPTDERACVICNIYETWGVYRAYGDQFEGAFVAVIGSSGRLELALVGDNAAKRLGIQRGAPVIVTWE